MLMSPLGQFHGQGEQRQLARKAIAVDVLLRVPGQLAQTARSLDLSMNGMSLMSMQLLNLGQMVEVQFDLLLGSERVSFALAGRVVHSVKFRNRGVKTGLQFVRGHGGAEAKLSKLLAIAG
jgi:hypothetical protein